MLKPPVPPINRNSGKSAAIPTNRSGNRAYPGDKDKDVQGRETSEKFRAKEHGSVKAGTTGGPNATDDFNGPRAKVIKPGQTNPKVIPKREPKTKSQLAEAAGAYLRKKNSK